MPRTAVPVPSDVDGAHSGTAVRSQRKNSTWRRPDSPSVAAAETVIPVPTAAPLAGAPSENALGAAPSAEIVIWSDAVVPAPFVATTLVAPGEENGVPVPSKL